MADSLSALTQFWQSKCSSSQTPRYLYEGTTSNSEGPHLKLKEVLGWDLCLK